MLFWCVLSKTKTRTRIAHPTVSVEQALIIFKFAFGSKYNDSSSSYKLFLQNLLRPLQTICSTVTDSNVGASHKQMSFLGKTSLRGDQ